MRSKILSDRAIFKIIWRFMIIARWIFRTLTCIRENDSSTKQQAAPCCESLWKRTLSAKTERVLNNHLTVSSFLFRFYLGIYIYIATFKDICLYYWLAFLGFLFYIKIICLKMNHQGRFDQAILELLIICVNY